ncbi:hypothetical protein [Clavibacter nebraskensis]|uniref:hypothetical protein n=1 Tax=Clavibacter nebraskensis TaxID=31963 RepID=UPI00200EB0C2|nr:hypothetical protein [Clavibacter nebraskensis]UQB13325.1 hypothetical protein LIX20_002727 [Clavibacter nebraskensis]
MTQITADFGISAPVSFVDVHVERDNLLFIDPSAIRAAESAGSRYGRQASAELITFFDFILAKLRSPHAADHAVGEESLQHFHEIGNTRLGMSAAGTDGHGAAEKLGTVIWAELFSNPLCQQAVAVLKFVEDIPVFVDDIDKDITSDITARIVFDTLANFTQDMMRAHPELEAKRPVAKLRTDRWDTSRAAWVSTEVDLPEADGKPLLLVPKDFVNFKIEMSFGQYLQVPLLSEIQSEDKIVVKRGKENVVRPRYSKKQLKPSLSMRAAVKQTQWRQSESSEIGV